MPGARPGAILVLRVPVRPTSRCPVAGQYTLRSLAHAEPWSGARLEHRQSTVVRQGCTGSPDRLGQGPHAGDRGWHQGVVDPRPAPLADDPAGVTQHLDV